MNTRQRLIQAATRLLDTGGEQAVTLRAVSNMVGVSHNAPYRHFKNREALLASVIANDFEKIGISLKRIRGSDDNARKKLAAACVVLIDYSRDHPARYRFSFETPDLNNDPVLESAGASAFGEFLKIVEECQTENILPNMEGASLAGLISATLHGLLALEASGNLAKKSGLRNVNDSMNLLLDVLSGSLGN